jgi:hypothetical protein
MKEKFHEVPWKAASSEVSFICHAYLFYDSV